MADYLITLLAGFTAGRLGHIIGGDVAWIPHHWIFGLILILMGLFFIYVKKIKYFGLVLLLVGIGVFISDFKDFLALKFFGADDVSFRRFWGID